jgi:hypothetical protein
VDLIYAAAFPGRIAFNVTQKHNLRSRQIEYVQRSVEHRWELVAKQRIVLQYDGTGKSVCDHLTVCRQVACCAPDL